MRRQRARERDLIAADRAHEEAERRRIEAEQAAENGHVANLQDTVVTPTPEWLGKGEVMPYTPRGRDGTVKSVVTVRRRLYDAVKHLEGRGVLDEEQAQACRWYRDLHEASQMDRSAGIASYGETIRGDMLYGHLPLSEWIARARADLRGARATMPVGGQAAIDAVVINNLPLERAARATRVHRRIITVRLKTVASILANLRAVRDGANENAR